MQDQRNYWMTLDAEDLASRLETYHSLKLESSYNPIYHSVIRNIYAYYSTIMDAQSWLTSLNYVGEQGELVKMSVPQSRTLLRQLLTLLTKQKLAFKAIARINDSKTQEAVRIANALSSDVIYKQRLDIKAERLMEKCLVTGTAFIKTTWRSDLGEPAGVVTVNGEEEVIYDGDVEVSVPGFFDVTYDFSIENWEDLDWVEVRVKRNRWSLIAQHPELKQEILNLPSIYDDIESRHYNPAEDRDLVYVYEMYHRPTPALPRGRMLFYGDSKCVFLDDINRYGCIPVEQLKPEPIEGLGYGYAMLSNMLPAQEMLDHSYSCLATNQSALGVSNILNPRGSNISVQSLYGMNFIDYDPEKGEPKKLDLLSSAPELFKLPEVLLGAMQQMSFVNAAVRGELPASTSGVAIATLTSNALEFLSAYSKTYQKVMEKTVMHAINAFYRFGKVERVVKIVGKNYQSFAKKFSPEILGAIEGMELQSINPLMQTIAGRIDIAEKAIEKGFVKDIEGYVAILDGAPLERITGAELSESDLIVSENEKMAEGTVVPVLATDDHAQHIYNHKTLLNDPETRMSSEITGLVQDHILEHLRLLKETDPLLMAVANTGKIPEGGLPGPIPPAQQMNAAPEGISPQDMAGGTMGMPIEGAAEPAQDLLGR